MTDCFNQRVLSASLIALGFSFISSPLFAAKPIDLFRQAAIAIQANVKELSREVDTQGMTHIRMQQIVNGYPVLGSDYIIHVPKGEKIDGKTTTINGITYENLSVDLKNPPSFIFNAEQKQKAMNYLIKLNHAKEKIQGETKINTLVYIDEKNVAHWAYLIQFKIQKTIPSYIIDPVTFKTYQQWDDLKTLETVQAGGASGNPRSGMKSYGKELPLLSVQRDQTTGTCYLRNDKATLKRYSDFADIQFSCEVPDRTHGIYWDAQEDFSGGGYSPSNDTLYAADVTWNMFENWYSMHSWKDKFGKAKRLIFFMHDGDANASFHNDGYIVIGDALHTNDFYPFTTIDIIAHEIGHGVTYQSSNLAYYSQPGSINESFSDMTGKAAEFYATGKVNWNVGEIWTDEERSIRYMDQPSKDCKYVTNEPVQPGGNCSIEHVDQIKPNDYLRVHFGSGIFNKAFYLLATTPNWDVKQAYQLMLHSNRYYWTEVSSFCQAARGTWLAAKQLKMNDAAVINAFTQVGIDPAQCK